MPDALAAGVCGVKSTSLRSIMRDRGCAPETSRETALVWPTMGRIDGDGASGGTSFDVGELGNDVETDEVAVVETDTFDPAEDVE